MQNFGLFKGICHSDNRPLPSETNGKQRSYKTPHESEWRLEEMSTLRWTITVCGEDVYAVTRRARPASQETLQYPTA
jgi:hypothetical protein